MRDGKAFSCSINIAQDDPRKMHEEPNKLLRPEGLGLVLIWKLADWRKRFGTECMMPGSGKTHSVRLNNVMIIRTGMIGKY